MFAHRHTKRSALLFVALGLSLSPAQAGSSDHPTQKQGSSMGEQPEYVKEAADLLGRHAQDLVEALVAYEDSLAKPGIGANDPVSSLKEEAEALVKAIEEWKEEVFQERDDSSKLDHAVTSVLRVRVERVGVAWKRLQTELDSDAAAEDGSTGTEETGDLAGQRAEIAKKVAVLQMDARFLLRDRSNSCTALKQELEDQAYVIIFNEANHTFEYPDKVLYEDMDVILCVEEADRAYRYQVSVGSTSKGADTDVGGVSAAVTTDLATPLQGASEVVDATLSCYQIYTDELNKVAKDTRKSKENSSEISQDERQRAYDLDPIRFDKLWSSCQALTASRRELIDNTIVVHEAAISAAAELIAMTNAAVSAPALKALDRIENPICEVRRDKDEWASALDDLASREWLPLPEEVENVPIDKLTTSWSM